jgi:uncharacterized protein YndB with AHSA1/START domain
MQRHSHNPSSTTDRIEKEIVLRAPRSRVWRALSDAAEFGAWFRVKLAQPFRPGAHITGQVLHPGYEHLTWQMTVERMEPERLFSFRWHPGAVNPDHDYSGEPTTLIEFTLEDAPGGTRLRLVESGFDALPAARRAEAFRLNDGGWTEQMKNIERHVASGAPA